MTKSELETKLDCSFVKENKGESIGCLKYFCSNPNEYDQGYKYNSNTNSYCLGHIVLKEGK